MAYTIDTPGLSEVIAKMQAYPARLNANLEALMNVINLTLWETVSPYPQPPENSTYTRTHLLAKSLGVSGDGEKLGSQPDIYDVKQIGGGWESHFGSNLDYAPYVIDEGSQAQVHQGRWWTIQQVAEKAMTTINRRVQIMIDSITNWLNND